MLATQRCHLSALYAIVVERRKGSEHRLRHIIVVVSIGWMSFVIGERQRPAWRCPGRESVGGWYFCLLGVKHSRCVLPSPNQGLRR